MNARRTAAVLVALLATSPASLAAQNRVVVSHDEWFTGSGFFNASEQQFMGNALSWFGVGSGSSVLLYTSNPFLTNAPFTSWLTVQGISVTQDAAAASFAPYDAVFTLGNPNMAATGAALASYVVGGGNVFAIGGSGISNEHLINNVFLSALGIEMLQGYNGLGPVNTAGFASQGPFGAALFTGVGSVYANNGNDMVLSAAPVPGVTNQVFFSGNHGVFAAAQVNPGSTVPEPGTVVLLATGLLGMAVVARRRRLGA